MVYVKCVRRDSWQIQCQCAVVCVSLCLFIIQFNPRAQNVSRRMYPDHEGNCIGDVSPNGGYLDKRGSSALSRRQGSVCVRMSRESLYYCNSTPDSEAQTADMSSSCFLCFPGPFFLRSWVSKTQPNHWTKRMATTRLTT